MSVAHAAFVVQGWLLEDLPIKEGRIMRKLCDIGYLHYADYYSNESQPFLGKGRGFSAEGEWAELILTDSNEHEMNLLKEVARKYFGITEPPKMYLISQVY